MARFNLTNATFDSDYTSSDESVGWPLSYDKMQMQCKANPRGKELKGIMKSIKKNDWEHSSEEAPLELSTAIKNQQDKDHGIPEDFNLPSTSAAANKIQSDYKQKLKELGKKKVRFTLPASTQNESSMVDKDGKDDFEEDDVNDLITMTKRVTVGAKNGTDGVLFANNLQKSRLKAGNERQRTSTLLDEGIENMPYKSYMLMPKLKDQLLELGQSGTKNFHTNETVKKPPSFKEVAEEYLKDLEEIKKEKEKQARLDRLPKHFKCKFCGMKFRIRSLLEAHKTEKHSYLGSSPRQKAPEVIKDTGFKCVYCDRVFSRVNALHIHHMNFCAKIPLNDRKNLQYTDLEHVQKPKVPTFRRKKIGQPKLDVPKTSQVDELEDNDSKKAEKLALDKARKSEPITLPNKTFQCLLCNQRFDSAQEFSNHSMIVHAKREMQVRRKSLKVEQPRRWVS